MSRTERLTLIATILGTTIVFLDSTVVSVALPAIQRDLDTGLAGQQWIVEAYMLTLVSLLLVGGSLGDLYGRKRLFMLGLVGFGVTSILCAIAPTDEALIGARALQGIAGALLVPGSLAILAATFEGEARGRAVGVWTAWAGISTLIGPAGGGLLVELDWRWIFWINIPLIAATLWLAHRAIAESSDPEACPGIDGIGIGLSALGLAGPVFALIEQPTRGFGDPVVWVPLAGGVACFCAFVWWESRARAPMLPLELFRSHNFSAVNAATLCVYAGLIGATFFITLFLQQVVGYTALAAGAATTPITIVMFLLSGRFGALASRIGPRLVMGIGPLLAAVGLALLVRLDRGGDYLVDVLPSMLLFGLGLSMTVAPLTTTVLDSVAERRAGVASGVNNAVARVAGVLAIAVLGAVLSAQFASTLDDRVAGATVGAEARAAIDDAKAQPLSGGDVSDVPAAEVAALDDDILSASESGFHLGMLLGAGLMALGGAIALIAVRNPEPTAAPAPELAAGPGAAATAGECGRAAEAPAAPEAEPEPSLAPSAPS
ncbi:MAG: DHA2 family efflux MFS transporter permease subunit [Solirubrobacterales bacterium]|nr:DHA2 family efflux MFS transporter permease subunit [Solirubrobacterales bacterium]